MRALRISGQVIVHATSRHADFHFAAHTACGIYAHWEAAIGDTFTLDPDDELIIIAEPVDATVDCMTCLVNAAR